MKASKAKKLSFLEWNNDIFVSSMKKIKLDIILIIILDSLFYVLSGYMLVFWLRRIQAGMAAFNLPGDVMSLGIEKGQELASDVKSFYYLIIFSFILVLVAIIFLASIIKGITWAKTTGAKISFKLISKFLALNLIWMGFWFLLVFLISLLVQPSLAPRFMVIAVILGLYFSNTLYTLFMHEQSLKSIFIAIKLNINKIHLFLLPYAIAGLLLFIILRAGNFLKFNYSSLVLGLLIITCAAFARYYVSELALRISKL